MKEAARGINTGDSVTAAVPNRANGGSSPAYRPRRYSKTAQPAANGSVESRTRVNEKPNTRISSPAQMA